MRTHLTGMHQDKQGRYFAVCKCGQNSGPNHFLVPGPAEDWILKHEQNVQRALASLRRARGDLRIERDHARTMLDDPNIPEREKKVWQILFDGANQRLNDGECEPQEGLF